LRKYIFKLRQKQEIVNLRMWIKLNFVERIV